MISHHRNADISHAGLLVAGGRGRQGTARSRGEAEELELLTAMMM